ncbi:MAG: type II secretion system F family protein [Kiritimatiellia bacterium]
MTILISTLFMFSFAGITYVVLSSFISGAEIYAQTYSQETATEFENIFLFIPSRRISDIGWSLAVAVFLILFMLLGNFRSSAGLLTGLLIASAGAYGAFHSPRYLLNYLKKKRLEKFNLQLVETLVNMSNALKAGFSITQAFEAVVKEGQRPIAQEFDVFLKQTRVGVNFSDAMQNLGERVQSEDLALVIAAIETARKTGGNLTEILENISHTIRERMRIELRIKTLTAQGRMQGIVAACMPAIMGGVLLAMKPDIMLPFLHSTVGVLTIGTVILLITAGWLVIKKIITIDI